MDTAILSLCQAQELSKFELIVTVLFVLYILTKLLIILNVDLFSLLRLILVIINL